MKRLLILCLILGMLVAPVLSAPIGGTVILAAVIAAFVFGMAGQITKTKTVAITAQRVSSTEATFTNMGGQDVKQLYSATSGEEIRISGSGTGNITKQVGNSKKITIGAAPAHVIATGEFDDGTFQVLLDTNI